MRPLLIPLALLIGSFALTACSTPPAAPTPTLVPLAGDETTATVMPTTRPLPSVTPLPTATATLAPTLTAVSATATATTTPGAGTPA
ncbi:MAG: hypothetical protein WA029_08775, partial [Anaerolineae bacterium]